MKKLTFAIAIALVSAAGLSAQSMYDGYTFAHNDYIGSAKSLALGSAVTAVGGDLGTIGINPAGSAVAGYSQFTISPGLSLSVGRSAYALSPVDAYGNGFHTSNPRFALPNIGLTSRFGFYEGGALRSVTFGFVVNTTADNNSMMRTSGFNSSSSKFAEMAAAATDLDIAPSALGASSFYNNPDYSNYWDVAMAYKLGLISSYGTDNEYVGCTETLSGSGDHKVPSELRHNSMVSNFGYKSDVLFNMGLNFNDNFYLGFNLGIPAFEYSRVENWQEVSMVPEKFHVHITYENGRVQDTYFNNAAYQYNYDASATGVYFKAGFIWTPNRSLRLGLAYQTRTYYDISETWQHSGQVNYADNLTYSGSGEEGYYSYSFHSPSILDAGMAWTFGRRAMISFDYELASYGRMRFADNDGDQSSYDYTNAVIKKFNAGSHNFRLGAEVNLTADLAVRAGAGLLISQELYYKNGGDVISAAGFDDDYYLGRKDLDAYTPHHYMSGEDLCYNVSLGFGYNPAGSFFADFAVRGTRYPVTVYRPYADYADVYAPEIEMHRYLINAVATLGWRF